MESYADVIAANLRAARGRAGITGVRLAARMNALGYMSWSSSKISQCEQGKRVIPAGDLLALADCLDTTLCDLLGGNMPPDTVVCFPDGDWHVTGVHVRNSAYGYRDYAVGWDDDDHPAVTNPVGPASSNAYDNSRIIAAAGPGRITRTP